MKAVLATACCWCLLAVGAQGARATAGPPIAAGQVMAGLLSGHLVRNTPDIGAKPVSFVAGERPITGERTTLPVLSHFVDGQGRTWLQVRLPGRALRRTPPPSTGWISASDTLGSTTPWHILVDLGARRVIVYHLGRPLGTFAAIVGKESTPTPLGEYFVEENVALPARDAGAPFALAISARSNVLQEFAGGPGQIALHGLENIGGHLGTAVSHGCVRLADSAVTWLAARIEPGVPVTIV